MARPRIRRGTVFTEVFYEDVARGSSWDTVKRERPATEAIRPVLEKALKMYIEDKIEPLEVHNEQSCFHEGIFTDVTRKVVKGKVSHKQKERDVEVGDIMTVKFIPRDPWDNREDHVIRMFSRDGSRADFPVPKGCKVPESAGEVVEAKAS